MRKWLSSIWHRSRRWYWARKTLVTGWCEDLPNRPMPGRIYIVGGRRHPWQAVLRCPCGCGELIYIMISPHQENRWQVREHEDGRLSLHPSIWRTKGCRAHFIIRRGRVQWCATPP